MYGAFLVCLALLLALDDSARCWLTLDHARSQRTAPGDSDEEEVLGKQPHRAAVASRRVPKRKRPPRPGVGAELASRADTPARSLSLSPLSLMPLRTPSAAHALVSPLRC
jgi:hypothetical protein